MIALGSTVSEGVARYFGVRKSLAAASAADQDVRAHASKIAELSAATAAELRSALHELGTIERGIRQGRLF